MILCALYCLVILILILIKPKIFIYWFFLTTYIEPVIVSYFLQIHDPQLFVFYLGGLVPFEFLNQNGIILMAIMYPILNISNYRTTILNSFRKSKRYLFVFTIVMFLLVLIKLLVYGDLSSSLSSLTTLLIFPTTLLNILHFFPTKKTAKELFNFFFYSTFILFFLFVYFSVIPHFQVISSFDFENRLSNYLYFGANGTAAFLGIFLFMLILKSKHVYGFLAKTLYILIIFTLLICILFTFTRTIIISLILILLIDQLFIQNKKSPILIFLISFAVLFYFGDEVLNILNRGVDTNSFDVDSEGDGTLVFRIYKLWLPSVLEIFINIKYILFGTEDKGFNQFLNRITGLSYANHNAFLFYLVSSGAVGVLLFFKFWINLFKDFHTQIFSGSNVVNKSDIKLCLYSTLLFFISINFMSTYHVLFIIQVSIIINYSISLSTRQNPQSKYNHELI